MRKRLILIGVFVLVLLLALALRLAYIQVVGHEELAEAAKRQQSIRLDGADSRGIIYDRNGVPLTGVNKEYVYIVPKESMDKMAEQIFDSMDARRLRVHNEDYRVYTAAKYNKEGTRLLEKEYGAYVMEAERRYAGNQPAVHIIGYVSPLDAHGVSGLELMFDKELSSRESKIYALADAKGKIIGGYGLSKISANDKAGITITIDSELQKKVETVLKNSGYNGAVAVLCARTGELLASASTPCFNPNAITSYMDSDNMELINKVTQGEYPPGSVFKIVVAAAALEGRVPDKEGVLVSLETKFVCRGEEDLYGLKIGCSTGGKTGHGSITLRDAFAKSCNCAFVQLGVLTGGEKIINMAVKLGLGQVPLQGFPDVKKGSVISYENAMWAGIGNLSIGQGEMLVTPLQIARMTNIIANGGLDQGVQLVKTEGQRADAKGRAFSRETAKRVISKETAEVIKRLMEGVMEYGTGSNVNFPVSVAGKTGSAEGIYKGQEAVHGWFTGFFPVENPVYTVTVFMENGKSGRSSAVPVFNEIAEYLYSHLDK